MLQYSAKIWENDDLPHQICNTCFLQLQNTINFKQLCETSDYTFRQIIEQNVVKVESDICNKEFKKAWVLGQHMHRAHKVKPLKCNKCEMKCYHPLHLKEHEELAHNPLNHTCDTCNRQFKDIYKLQRHKFTHSSRSHHCQRCDKSFKDKWSLKKHNQEMHSLIEKNAACHVCGKSILKKNLSIHMQTHKERDKISCEICLKTFFHRQSLENHIKYIHENQAPERNYLCNVCGRAVRSQAELSRHLLIHTKERPYACNHCDKTYRRSEALKMHVSRAHLDERNFVCTFCSQAFYDKKILLNHVRRHTGERPFKCNICDKAFIQKVALRIHMQVHTHSV
ncbi:zinc finger protein 84-like [Chrysoperla carnea]|uniref:zinc finger protein 84-like n=1 Tax=Chrysoperla carnea TaxID=189513 RepID=UPI001D082AB4|nr:zinc finger protein 84-like [Chrysoperla carnea]